MYSLYYNERNDTPAMNTMCYSNRLRSLTYQLANQLAYYIECIINILYVA